MCEDVNRYAAVGAEIAADCSDEGTKVFLKDLGTTKLELNRLIHAAFKRLGSLFDGRAGFLDQILPTCDLFNNEVSELIRTTRLNERAAFGESRRYLRRLDYLH